eukprot:305781-Chlamydomonas_euryale.AAC.2
MPVVSDWHSCGQAGRPLAISHMQHSDPPLPYASDVALHRSPPLLPPFSVLPTHSSLGLSASMAMPRRPDAAKEEAAGARHSGCAAAPALEHDPVKGIHTGND